MQYFYDSQALKKSTNLSVNSDLLRKAKELGINLSATFEKALAKIVRQKERAMWLAENKASIDAYNQHIEEHGVFSDDLRSF